ncbi:RelA/SpoT domain-containing protein [Bradyrhizobium sp. I71]|uniref:RelA/SpoT domain-containing protein n=1 Tax=Bradyrhizobium sp. I71 TaxID=2590772 RepID=UPI0021122F2A|nr:RelA/SpoT domain-containing protein [Bradyrhizobium sp. I71]ULK97697.1 RelA/SpoT domain-containing protein [Bradyrhizobium sp. I71]
MTGNDRSWIEETLSQHRRLTPAVVGLLQSILDRSSIQYLSVSGRTKETTSTEEKIRRKKYTQPEQQLTDLSGIRVITFLETQVKEISSIIRATFDVDDKNSFDRAYSATIEWAIARRTLSALSGPTERVFLNTKHLVN